MTEPGEQKVLPPPNPNPSPIPRILETVVGIYFIAAWQSHYLGGWRGVKEGRMVLDRAWLTWRKTTLMEKLTS